MRDSLERLRQLPWLILLQAAVLTTIAAIVLEYLLLLLATYVPAMRQLLVTLTSPGIGFITVFVIAMGVGVLALGILERLNRVVINTGSLWGLIACLAVMILVVQAFGLFAIGLVGMRDSELIGIVLGIFLKGQPYWKSYRRW